MMNVRDIHASLAAGHGTHAVHSDMAKNMERTEADSKRISAMRAATLHHPGPLSAIRAKGKPKPERAARPIIGFRHQARGGMFRVYWAGPGSEDTDSDTGLP
jgi:hypothetical protein